MELVNITNHLKEITIYQEKLLKNLIVINLIAIYTNLLVNFTYSSLERKKYKFVYSQRRTFIICLK